MTKHLSGRGRWLPSLLYSLWVHGKLLSPCSTKERASGTFLQEDPSFCSTVAAFGALRCSFPAWHVVYGESGWYWQFWIARQLSLCPHTHAPVKWEETVFDLVLNLCQVNANLSREQCIHVPTVHMAVTNTIAHLPCPGDLGTSAMPSGYSYGSRVAGKN